jgi:kynurenine formamidase
VDLSHCLTEELSRISLLPPPTFRQITKLPEDHANVTQISMVAHVGTHLDAPCHFIYGAPSAEEVPLDRLYGTGVVWRIDVPPLSEIDVHHLEAARPQVQPGDIVLISTGWAQHINTEYYEDHPALSVAAAEWLVEHQVKMVGVDFSTPDLTVHKRPKNFTWPVHQVLLGNGVLIAEHVTNMGSLENRAIEAMFLGLNIKGSDGMPARPIARAIA